MSWPVLFVSSAGWIVVAIVAYGVGYRRGQENMRRRLAGTLARAGSRFTGDDL